MRSKFFLFPLISLPLLSLFVYADSSIENIINNKVLVNGVSSEINGVLSSIPYSTKIIPYKEGSIIVGVGFNKVNSLTKDYDSEGFVQVLDKQGKKILNKSKQFFVDFKKAGILGGILDKEQNNLIFYGYSEANGVLNHFDVLPSEFKHNSVFIGKYNIESNTFQDIKLLDDNSVTTPNTLAMDTDGNFYILYSLEASEQEKDYKKLSTNVFKRTNQVKLVKLNSKLEKLDEKILEECDKCNLNAGGLIIDHSDTLYSAILKNSSELILKTDSFANDQEFSRQSIKFMDSEKSNKSSVHTTVEKIILNNKSIHILVNNKLNKNNGNSILFSYKNNRIKKSWTKENVIFHDVQGDKSGNLYFMGESILSKSAKRFSKCVLFKMSPLGKMERIFSVGKDYSSSKHVDYAYTYGRSFYLDKNKLVYSIHTNLNYNEENNKDIYKQKVLIGEISLASIRPQ